MLETAVQLLDPRCGALQPVGGADIEHQEAVDVADQRLVVEITGQQLCVLGGHAAVAADVEVPSVLGGDDADVLAAGLGALAGAARDAHLDLVRGPQAAVAELEVDGHLHRVLLPVAAPVAADAALHRAQRLAVCVAGLHPAVDEAAPDLGQLIDPGAEHVDALAAGDLGVQVEIPCDLADQDQLLRR